MTNSVLKKMIQLGLKNNLNEKIVLLGESKTMLQFACVEELSEELTFVTFIVEITYQESTDEIRFHNIHVIDGYVTSEHIMKIEKAVEQTMKTYRELTEE